MKGFAKIKDVFCRDPDYPIEKWNHGFNFQPHNYETPFRQQTYSELSIYTNTAGISKAEYKPIQLLKNKTICFERIKPYFVTLVLKIMLVDIFYDLDILILLLTNKVI